ncbi:MAG: hypothetical protein U9R64_09035 [Pseudomonadota bacterium]|nr:hypothetical protein [Pseudomonadota bacterium]
MNRPAPARLLAIVREERARRQAAWDRAGQGGSDIAINDNIIWSNIEHFMRVLGGDRRAPTSWSEDNRGLMASNLRATLAKACQTFEAKPSDALRAKIDGLRHLIYAVEFTSIYCRDHPVPVPPGNAIDRAARLLDATPADAPGMWQVAGRDPMSVGQLLFLAANVNAMAVA